MYTIHLPHSPGNFRLKICALIKILLLLTAKRPTTLLLNFVHDFLRGEYINFLICIGVRIKLAEVGCKVARVDGNPCIKGLLMEIVGAATTTITDVVAWCRSCRRHSYLLPHTIQLWRNNHIIKYLKFREYYLNSDAVCDMFGLTKFNWKCEWQFCCPAKLIMQKGFAAKSGCGGGQDDNYVLDKSQINELYCCGRTNRTSKKKKQTYNWNNKSMFFIYKYGISCLFET